MHKALIEPFQYPKSEQSKKSKVDGVKKPKQRAQNWKSTVLRIWSYMAEHKRRIGLVMFLVGLSSALALLGPLLIGKAIDDYLATGETAGFPLLLLGLAAVYVLQSLSGWLQNFFMIGVAQRVVYTMRVRLFAHLQKLPIPYFDKKQHGELMSRMTNDIENVSSTLNSSVIQIFSSVLILTGTVSVMLWLSPLLTLLTFTIIPLMYLGMRWITNRTGRLFKEQQRNLGDMNGYIEETISGQRIVKAFSREKHVMSEFRQRNDRYRISGFWAQAISGYIPKLMNALNNLSFAIIAGVGGLMAYHHMITIGSILVFIEYSRQFTRPLHDLSNQFNTLLSAVAGAERVFEVLDEPKEARDEEKAHPIGQVYGKVEFDDVSFGYEKSGNTLKHISFDAEQGETIALVGPTGAGKTTLIHLLARFYEKDSGRILIDGVPIDLIQRESLRSHMAVVLQDPFLFQGTVKENIRFGRPEADDEEIVEAAKLANAHSFIMKLPEQYETVIKQDGVGISQGQKQLISIARAVLAKPSILILDEATSNIDTVTEIKIQEALLRLMEGRTSFVIAHRLNTIRNADRILVLKDGQIIESGTHESLLKQGGFYYELNQHFNPNRS